MQRTPKEQALHSIRQRAKRIEKLSDQQRLMIRAAHQEGASLREIADAAGQGHSTVKRVLDRVG